MQSRFWQCDDVLVGLDDRDVKVRFTHFVTHAVVTVELRMSEKALNTSVEQLRIRAEALAGDCVRDLASFLDRV